jgi:hypothetical protein
VVGLKLNKRGLEITEKYEELQLGFESLKMENVAAQAGESKSPD